MSGRLSYIGWDLHSRLKRFFDAPPGAGATPLELCQAVLDDIERRIEPVGRGRRVFPYSRLLVRVRQLHADRADFESVFGEELVRRIRERLEEVRCDAPRALDVSVTCVTDAPAGWSPDQLFAVEYAREPRAPGATAAARALPPAVHVTVLRGASTANSYTFTDSTISIGRSTDATDELGRIRRNTVAFLDTIDGITETVGRAHARLRFESPAEGYRLFDEGSSNGTAIIRAGTTIAVPPRDPRGVRVQSGDEVVIGRAVIRVTLDG